MFQLQAPNQKNFAPQVENSRNGGQIGETVRTRDGYLGSIFHAQLPLDSSAFLVSGETKELEVDATLSIRSHMISSFETLRMHTNTCPADDGSESLPGLMANGSSTLLSPIVTPSSETSGCTVPFVPTSSIRTPRPPPLSTDLHQLPFGKRNTDDSPLFSTLDVFSQGNCLGSDLPFSKSKESPSDKTSQDLHQTRINVESHLHQAEELLYNNFTAPFLGSRTTRQSRLSASSLNTVAQTVLSPCQSTESGCPPSIQIFMPRAAAKINIDQLESALEFGEEEYEDSTVTGADNTGQNDHYNFQWDDSNIDELYEDIEGVRKRIRQGSPTFLSGLSLIRIDSEAQALKEKQEALNHLHDKNKTGFINETQKNVTCFLTSSASHEGRSCDIIQKNEQIPKQHEIDVRTRTDECFDNGYNPSSLSFSGEYPFAHIAIPKYETSSPFDTNSSFSTAATQQQVESPLLFPISRMQLISSVSLVQGNDNPTSGIKLSSRLQTSDIQTNVPTDLPPPHSANPYLSHVKGESAPAFMNFPGLAHPHFTGTRKPLGMEAPGTASNAYAKPHWNANADNIVPSADIFPNVFDDFGNRQEMISSFKFGPLKGIKDNDDENVRVSDESIKHDSPTLFATNNLGAHLTVHDIENTFNIHSDQWNGEQKAKDNHMDELNWSITTKAATDVEGTHISFTGNPVNSTLKSGIEKCQSTFEHNYTIVSNPSSNEIFTLHDNVQYEPSPDNVDHNLSACYSDGMGHGVGLLVQDNSDQYGSSINVSANTYAWPNLIQHPNVISEYSINDTSCSHDQTHKDHPRVIDHARAGRNLGFQDICSPSGSIISNSSRSNLSVSTKNPLLSSPSTPSSTSSSGTTRSRRSLSTTSHLGVLDPSVAVSTALLPQDLLLRSGLVTNAANGRIGKKGTSKSGDEQKSIDDSGKTRSSRSSNGANATQNVIYPASSLLNAKASFICAVENRRKYLCRVCGKQFTQRGGLHIHMRIHLGQKPFVCETCGAAFSQACNLKRHMRSHTGERPHACLQCGKRFNRKWSLEKHYLTHLKSMRPGLVDIANTIASQQQQQQQQKEQASSSTGFKSPHASVEESGVRPLPHVVQRMNLGTELKSGADRSSSAERVVSQSETLSNPYSSNIPILNNERKLSSQATASLATSFKPGFQ